MTDPHEDLVEAATEAFCELMWGVETKHTMPVCLEIKARMRVAVDAVLSAASGEASGDIERLTDKVEGLECDLDNMLDVLWRRGDQGARDWIRLNYKGWLYNREQSSASRPAPSEAPNVELDVSIATQIAALVSREVAELPDRTSPPDEPMLLLVTERELQEIIMPHLASALDAARAEGIAAERERCETITVWHPIETAPEDGSFVAATQVYVKGNFSRWDMHVVWRDDETGDIATECDQGWRLSDYSHWTDAPAPPFLAPSIAQGSKP